MKTELATNLRCGACVAKLQPIFDAAEGIDRWSVDLSREPRRLIAEGPNAQPEHLAGLLAQAGFQVVPDNDTSTRATAVPPTSGPTLGLSLGLPPSSSPAGRQRVETITNDNTPNRWIRLFPLFLIVSYLLLSVLAYEVATGTWSSMRAMNHFMAGFFLVFSFFKMLDVRRFAASFAMYDVVARRLPWYGLCVPFLELALGMMYLMHLWPILSNSVTLVFMLLGTIGVARTLWTKQSIRCACLGTVFNLPMTTVTLVENLSMVAMAGFMLLESRF